MSSHRVLTVMSGPEIELKMRQSFDRMQQILFVRQAEPCRASAEWAGIPDRMKSTWASRYFNSKRAVRLSISPRIMTLNATTILSSFSLEVP